MISKLSTIFALASLIFLASLVNSDQRYTLIKSLCSNVEHDLQTSYKNNLANILSSFPSKVSQNLGKGYYAANTTFLDANNSESETIYALALCQGDTTLIDCKTCVSIAINNLPTKGCENAKSEVIWYDKCMVRYSNKSFLTKVDEDVKFGWKNNKLINISITPTDAVKSMILGCDTLFDLAFALSSSKVNYGLLEKGDRKYYKTKDVAYNSTVSLYAMAQCTPDLSPADCGRCLRLIINEMTSYCNGSKSVRLLNPSCNTRCEIYRQPPIPSPKSLAKGSSIKRRTLILVVLPTSAALSILLCIGVWYCVRNRIARKTTNVDISEIKQVMDSLQFDVHEIRAATRNFAPYNKLGEGGFGEVYKGILENGLAIAVKRLSKRSEQGIKEFKTEVVLVAKLQHKNLVKLVGFCVALKEKILVYEYLPNSSLDRFLFDKNNTIFLDWQKRFKIILGIARGLLYLHEDSPLTVIHRDLKSSNILLDEDMNPKISDFGLAKLFGLHQTQGDTNRIVGTYGYMAPEYAITGNYSVKSDIYSFGVIVLEVVSGERNGFFQGYQLEEALLYRAWRLWNDSKPLDLVDARLKDFPVEEVIKCIHIGLLCVQDYAIERPRMTSIVAALTRQSVSSLPVPKSPHLIRNINNCDDDLMLSEDNTKYVHTGTETIITTLLPRD